MFSQRIASSDTDPALRADDRVVFTLDVSGNIKSLNSAGERLTGYNFEELKEMKLTEILSAQGATTIRRQFEQTLGDCFGSVFEIEITTKDGRRVKLETSLDLRREKGVIEFMGIALPNEDRPLGDRTLSLDEHFTA